MFFISYSLLSTLAQYDNTMAALVRKYKALVKQQGVPECDFKVYRKTRNLSEIFLQALRRLILLNKQKRSQINKLKKVASQTGKMYSLNRGVRVSSTEMQTIETQLFYRLQAKNSVALFDSTRLKLKLIDDQLTKIHSMLQEKTQAALDRAIPQEVRT